MHSNMCGAHLHIFSTVYLTSLCSVLLFGVGHQLKLCDFGTATKIEHTLTNGVGTVRYMAPEVIKGMYMILKSRYLTC